MNLEQCYQLFNLQPGTTPDEVRAAYRKLARVMHPDVNPEDIKAHSRFVTLNQAYQLLLENTERPLEQQAAFRPPTRATANPSPTHSRQEADLKWQTYQKLQELLRNREFIKTVALVDGLAQRMESDQDVKQWQGIVYYFFGQHLVDRDQLDKARIYLRKSLKADPNNPQLAQQVKHEYRRIEQIMARL